jgi:hypothetical protein
MLEWIGNFTQNEEGTVENEERTVLTVEKSPIHGWYEEY